MKKLLSVFLAALLILSLAAPALAAEQEYPTIYVTGAQTNDLYDADNNRIYPLPDDIDAMQVIKDNLMPCLRKLAFGLVTDNYEAYAEEFYNAFVPIYEDIALDKNGEVSNGSHPARTIYNADLPRKSGGYGEWDYRFWYDWRISPMLAADELKEWIDMVKDATGKDKVNLMGRCYGANVIAAYLYKYEKHALENVNGVAYLSSSIIGIDMLAALFSGELRFEDQAIENFVEFFMDKENLIEDETVKIFVLSLVELFNQIKLLGVTGEKLEELVAKVKDDLIPPLLRDTFGSMPAYWSMCTPEVYEDAIDFVFGGHEKEYAKLIEKTDDYYYNVQLGVEDKMVEFKEKGIDFQILVKYNFPDYPLYNGATGMSDGNTLCVRQGFGGEYADFNTEFSDKYIASLKNKTYLSADRKINAESCLFPENTWFVKNIHHDHFPSALTSLVMEAMNKHLTVSDGVYSQFLEYTDNRLIEVTPEENKSPAMANKALEIYLRFFAALLRFLTKLMRGELQLGM